MSGKHFISILSQILEPQEVGGISPTFQMTKLRPKELKAFARGQAVVSGSAEP